MCDFTTEHCSAAKMSGFELHLVLAFHFELIHPIQMIILELYLMKYEYPLLSLSVCSGSVPH
uniref:Uncharacterized protein n=1 Tax=Anguilla anguilla TaxID=7936 RepID=A0A0E9X191_ANGAN